MVIPQYHIEVDKQTALIPHNYLALLFIKKT